MSRCGHFRTEEREILHQAEPLREDDSIKAVRLRGLTGSRPSLQPMRESSTADAPTEVQT